MKSTFVPDTEFETSERCFIVEIHNRSEDPACSIARVRVAPGVTTQRHALIGVEERYVVLSGEGTIEVGTAEPILLRALDVAYISAGQSQRITNAGGQDLVFLAICTPRFEPQWYRSLQE